MVKLGDGGADDGLQPDRYICHTLDSKTDSEPHSIGSGFSSYSQIESQKEKEQSGFERTVNGESKQVLVIDDDHDNAFTVKSCLESYSGLEIETFESKTEFHPIQVTIYVDPILALLEFKPYHYDLLLVDIDMPSISGYELVERIVKLDFNIKVCFMSAGEINYEAIREIRHPSRSIGCFIKKPASRDELVNRVLEELY